MKIIEFSFSKPFNSPKIIPKNSRDSNLDLGSKIGHHRTISLGI